MDVTNNLLANIVNAVTKSHIAKENCRAVRSRVVIPTELVCLSIDSTYRFTFKAGGRSGGKSVLSDVGSTGCIIELNIGNAGKNPGLIAAALGRFLSTAEIANVIRICADNASKKKSGSH